MTSEKARTLELNEIEVGSIEFSSIETKAFGIKPAFLLALLANILWGASFLASKYTLKAWGPFTSSSLRFGIATVALFGALTIMNKRIDIPKKISDWLGIIAIATTAFGALYPLQLAGLKYIPSSMSAAIMLISPLIVLVLGKVILKENLNSQKIIGLLFGMVGGSILLLTSNSVSIDISGDFLMGSILTLTSACSLALSVVLTRKYSKEITSSSLTFWSMSIGWLELTVAAFIFEENLMAGLLRNASLLSWLSVFFLALICSSFCFFIWNYSLSKASSQEIASSMHVKTPTAVLIGAVIANEDMTINLITGTLLVMMGVWLSQTNCLGSKK